MNHSTPTQMIDTTGNTYLMEITPVGIMLDGKPYQINVKETQIALISADHARDIITLVPTAFWHAFVGSGDPTPESAGLLLAEVLARHGAIQEIAELVLRVRPLLAEIEAWTEEKYTAMQLATV